MLLKSVLLHGEYMVVGASEFFLTFQGIFIRTDSTKSTGICHKPHPTCILLQPILCQWEMCLPHTVFFVTPKLCFLFVFGKILFSVPSLYYMVEWCCPVLLRRGGDWRREREKGRLSFSLFFSLSLSLFPPPLRGTIPHTPLSFPSFFGSFVKLSPFWHVKSALFLLFSFCFFLLGIFFPYSGIFCRCFEFFNCQGMARRERKKEAWMESAML